MISYADAAAICSRFIEDKHIYIFDSSPSSRRLAISPALGHFTSFQEHENTQHENCFTPI
jgi:hypothetical protein